MRRWPAHRRGLFIRFSTARRRDHVQLPGSPNDFARLTTRHLSAAAQLFLHGPLTVRELTEQLAVTYATASLVATDLEGLAQSSVNETQPTAAA